MLFLLSKRNDRGAPCYSQLLKPSTHKTGTLYQYFTVFFNASVTLRTKFSPLIPLFICMEICYPHGEHRPRPRAEEIHYYTNLIVILLRQTSVIRIFLYQNWPTLGENAGTRTPHPPFLHRRPPVSNVPQALMSYQLLRTTTTFLWPCMLPLVLRVYVLLLFLVSLFPKN